jgi:hypothetical protein
MPSVTIRTTISGDPKGAYSKDFSVAGGGQVVISEPIADGATDLEVACVLDVSQVKFFALKATQDIVVKTNSAGAPDNTFTLDANSPYLFPASQGEVWADTDPAAITTDITALFVTNASGVDTVLSVDAVYDPTV